MKKIALLVLLNGLFLGLFAQEHMYSIGYHMGVPSGELRTFSDEPSFRGFSFEYHYFMENDLVIGGGLGWNIFNETFPRDTYTFDEGAVTMKQWRYTHVVPITASLKYRILDSEPVGIFAGFGAGLYYINQEIWAGLLEFRFDSWRFGMYPEVGLSYKFNPNFGMSFATRYQWSPNGHLDGEDHLGFWDFRFGVHFIN